jgi:hypothetical protein
MSDTRWGDLVIYCGWAGKAKVGKMYRVTSIWNSGIWVKDAFVDDNEPNPRIFFERGEYQLWVK